MIHRQAKGGLVWRLRKARKAAENAAPVSLASSLVSRKTDVQTNT
jgi:hypothetical protein